MVSLYRSKQIEMEKGVVKQERVEPMGRGQMEVLMIRGETGHTNGKRGLIIYSVAQHPQKTHTWICFGVTIKVQHLYLYCSSYIAISHES